MLTEIKAKVGDTHEHETRVGIREVYARGAAGGCHADAVQKPCRRPCRWDVREILGQASFVSPRFKTDWRTHFGTVIPDRDIV